MSREPRRTWDVRNRIYLIYSEPFSDDVDADVRLILMIGCKHLYLEAMLLWLEIFNRHLCDEDCIRSVNVGIQALLVVQDTSFEGWHCLRIDTRLKQRESQHIRGSLHLFLPCYYFSNRIRISLS